MMLKGQSAPRFVTNALEIYDQLDMFCVLNTEDDEEDGGGGWKSKYEGI